MHLKVTDNSLYNNSRKYEVFIVIPLKICILEYYFAKGYKV